MAGSEVEICNEALSRIGQSLLLTDTGQTPEEIADALQSPQAQQSAFWYPKCRDKVLRRFKWPFATHREKLAIVAGETRSDWTYVYGVPADCLAIRFVSPPGMRNPRPSQIPPTKIEARKDPSTGAVVGKLILTDQKDAELVYTMRVENPAAFDPDFESALAYCLAAELARTIPGIGPVGRALATDMSNAYELEVRRAAAAALNEQTDEPEPTGELLASRS